MKKHSYKPIIIITLSIIIASSTSCFQLKSTEEILKEEGGISITLGISNSNSNNNLDKSLKNTVAILESRFLKFGLKHYKIDSDKTSKTITLKLPHIKNLERLKNIIMEQGDLGFWETFANEDVFEYLSYANQYLNINNINDKLEKLQPDSSSNEPGDPALELITKLEQDGKLDTETEKLKKENPLFCVLTPNAHANGQLINKSANIGISSIEDTAIVNKYLALDSIKQKLPENLKLLWGIKPFDQEEEYIYLVAIKVTTPNKTPALGSEAIKNAKADFNPYNGSPEVMLEMNDEGSTKWADITRNNIGREIAIVLDNKVYSHPRVTSEITGGRSSISGAFSYEEAKDLATVLNSGKIPFHLKIIKEEIIAPE